VKEMDIEEMLEELEMYYEAAGFKDIFNEELKYKTEDEIRELYRATFEEDCEDKE